METKGPMAETGKKATPNHGTDTEPKDTRWEFC